jgi:hypothetical protein
MKSFPKHFMVAIVLFVVAGIIGGGLWFWTGSQLSESLSEKQQLETQIITVSGRGIFPSRQHLEQIEASTQEIIDLISPVQNAITETSQLFDSVRGKTDSEGKYSGVSANDWKRMLGEKRDELIALAGKNTVELPEIFYLGFERYRALSPAEDATYHLGIQLLALDEILNIALESDVTAITEILRVYAEDKNAVQGGDGLGAKLAQGPKDWYTIYPFELSFSAPAKAVSELSNKITASPYFFVIRFIDVENQKTSVPRKSEVFAQAGGDQAQKNIIPVVGQEEVKVTIRVDLILWALQNESAAEEKKEAAK